MQHFFVTPDQVLESQIIIEGSDVNHMKNVLRMKIGEELVVSDGNNHKYLCEIEDYDGKQCYVSIKEELPVETELPSKLYLFQGLPKSDKMELIIQKAVELGVYQIIPVSTKRTVVKLDSKKEEKKITRWNEIAKSAAKQSGREIIPEVDKIHTFSEALEKMANLDVALIPYELAEGMEYTRNIFRQIVPGQSVGILIGPEGGFEKEEVSAALEKGIKEITLGKRILRTETAGLTTLSILMYHLEP